MIYLSSTTKSIGKEFNLAHLHKILETDTFPENVNFDPSGMDEDSRKYYRLCAIVSHTENGKKKSHFTVSMSISGLMDGICSLTGSTNGVHYNAEKYHIYVFRKIHLRQYMFLFPFVHKLIGRANDLKDFMRATTPNVITSAAKKRKSEYYEVRTMLESSISHLTLEQQLDTLLTVISADIVGFDKIN